MNVKKLASLIFSFFILSVIVFSCSRDSSVENSSKELVLPDTPYQYNFSNSEKVQLGRVLFYDQSLSLNNSTSCGSCHMQSRAFSDVRRFSKGFEGREVSRNTPPIQNLGLGQSLFWDGREKVLQNMVIMPVVNHIEMGVFDMEQMVEKVQSRSYYPTLFEEAYSTSEITTDRISEALSAFVVSMSSRTSKFDRHMSMPGPFNGSNNNAFTSTENRGMNLFFGTYDCASCHNLTNPAGYSQSAQQFEMVNVGLDMNYQDKGMGEVTGDPADDGRFKIPNLRNIEITGPYMHDGRFSSLEEVIDHYSTNVKDHPNLDSRLKDNFGQPMVLNIPDEDKRALIAFLKTLTDHQFINDVRFSDPFVAQ